MGNYCARSMPNRAPLPPKEPNGPKVGGKVAIGGKGPKAAAAAAQKMLFSSDGKALAFQSAPGATIVVMDTSNGKQISMVFPVASSPAMQGAFSPDGRCLALENNDGAVILYELATGQPRGKYGSKLPQPPVAEAVGALLAGGAGGPGGFGGGPASLVLSKKSSVSFAISPNGKLLALSGPGGSVHVWDILTAKEIMVFKGHTQAVSALAFAPHGKTLASASADTTALIWDVTKVKQAAPPAEALKPGGLETWWLAMADNDAVTAFAAMGNFIAVPNDAVAWIKERLKPAAPPDKKRVENLLGLLDNDQFQARDKATRELLKIGEEIVPALDKALATNPSQESKQRLEGLRGKLTGMTLQGERLRAYRAIEVLELIGTPEARQVLQAARRRAAPKALNHHERLQAAAGNDDFLRHCEMKGEILFMHTRLGIAPQAPRV